MRAAVLLFALLAVVGGADNDTTPADITNGTETPSDVVEPVMITTESGLKYGDRVVGDGKKATTGSTVGVLYTGSLHENGKVFDSSGDGPPISFVLGAREVIAGWDEGIQGMRVGGKRLLVIPSDLAYGDAGRPPQIPPKAVLDFHCELVSVAESRWTTVGGFAIPTVLLVVSFAIVAGLAAIRLMQSCKRRMSSHDEPTNNPMQGDGSPDVKFARLEMTEPSHQA